MPRRPYGAFFAAKNSFSEYEARGSSWMKARMLRVTLYRQMLLSTSIPSSSLMPTRKTVCGGNVGVMVSLSNNPSHILSLDSGHVPDPEISRYATTTTASQRQHYTVVFAGEIQRASHERKPSALFFKPPTTRRTENRRRSQPAAQRLLLAN